MTLEQLIALIHGDDKSASEAAARLLVGDLSGSITLSEQKLADSILSRDKAKSTINLFRSAFSIPSSDEITEQTFASIKEANKGTDAERDLKIETLTEANNVINNELTAAKNEFSAKLSELKKRNSMSDLGTFDAISPHALNTIRELAMHNSVIDGDGNITYEVNGVIERIDGKPMTPADKINQLKTNTDTAYLFNQKGSGGSGTVKAQGSGEESKYARRIREAGL